MPHPAVSKFAGVVLALASVTAGATIPAKPAAIVVSLVGTVWAQIPGRRIRILTEDAALSAQETVTTQQKSYARLRFSDGGQITLRPETSLRIDAYHFNKNKPAKDNLVFSLLKGGMRAISGLIGHRGNRNAYRARAGAAVIGIRGTHYGLLLCDDNCQGLLVHSSATASKGSRADKQHESSPSNGLYLEVLAGRIVVNNKAGARDYVAGQYGYVRSKHALPVQLSRDPGLQQALPANMGGMRHMPGLRKGEACVAR